MAEPSAPLSLLQLAVGYEWLVSGLSKLAHGDFATGLAAELRDLAGGASPWYGHILRTAVVPHAVVFGYVIECAELAAGLVLVGVAIAELAAGHRISARTQRVFRPAVAASLLAGIVMVANFELANGGTFGLRLAADSFDEGVDLDTVLLAAQLALLVPLLRLAHRDVGALQDA